jgi:hypothetical protein
MYTQASLAAVGHKTGGLVEALVQVQLEPVCFILPAHHSGSFSAR